MFDPFVDADPSVLVHEVDGAQFATLWKRLAADGDTVACPLCGRHGVARHGNSPRNHRPWICFSCGDVITQEITAG
jgi:predicted RNA-binding Zn-ribbon protein involved in translation (DUF1610 family)